MCTYSSGRDACQYDSGGPLYYTLNGRVNIVGIISFGTGCGGGYPSVNTRVTSFIQWIQQVTYNAVYF